jgi:hypothetical protein
MKKITIAFVLLAALILACNERPLLKNRTRSAGYAKGENILLTFNTGTAKGAPDSVQVFVLEKKTGYEYLRWARKGDCDVTCAYSIMWDGRKPDGSWPMGGVYLVYAKAPNRPSVFSDTVQIGLTD